MHSSTKNLLWTAITGVALVAVVASGQTANLTADTVALSPQGGTIKLLAALQYAERPAAIGWVIELPDGWSLESVGGGAPPQVLPRQGSAGALEFAYANVPEFTATFELVVRYPAKAPRAEIASTVFLRAAGGLSTLKPRPVQISVP